MVATIKFAKLRDGAIIPTKKEEDAGLDIYACFDEDYMVIPPHTTKLIPTGICSAFDKDYMVLLEERGSTGSKGIKRSAGVIDSGYRGEWFVALTNSTNKTLFITKLTKEETTLNHYGFIKLDNIDNHVIIYPYTKAIVQALVIPVPKLDIEEWTVDEVKSIKSERGKGALGSSGK